MVQSGVSPIWWHHIGYRDVLCRWSRRSWRFSLQILQHFSDCVWPQLSSHLLCWSCGQHACLHLRICCVTDSEKAVLWCASCQPGNGHCICITGSELVSRLLAPACAEKQCWGSIWSEGCQRSRRFGSPHRDSHILSKCHSHCLGRDWSRGWVFCSESIQRTHSLALTTTINHYH